jgi:DNA-binding transcriptional LysR family regulator
MRLRAEVAVLDLRQIRYFVCLYEEGNVTRAARRLNVVQPALSMQIGRIEKRLGVVLFERNARGVAPTAAAEAMYKIYSPIMLDLRHADQLMMEMNGRVLGRIAVGIIPSITNSVLADVLSRFGSEFPDVELRIDEAYSGTLIDWVIAGDLDLAIVNHTRRKTGVTVHPLIEEELVLVQSSREGGDTEPIQFRKLRDLLLVLPSRRHGLRSIVDSAAEQHDLLITPQIEVDALTPTLKLVASSNLSAVLPAITVRRAGIDLPLRARRIIEPSLSRQLVYVYRNQRLLPRSIEAFIETLSDELKIDMAPTPPRTKAAALS